MGVRGSMLQVFFFHLPLISLKYGLFNIKNGEKECGEDAGENGFVGSVVGLLIVSIYFISWCTLLCCDKLSINLSISHWPPPFVLYINHS